MQAAVTTANQTYQDAQQQVVRDNITVVADTNKLNALTLDVTIAAGIAGVSGLLAAIEAEVVAISQLGAAPATQIPILGVGLAVGVAVSNVIASTFGLIAAVATDAAFAYQVKLNDAAAKLSTDGGVLASDQAIASGALAQLQADMDTQTALTAAYDVAEQAYTASEQAYTNDQATSAWSKPRGKPIRQTPSRASSLLPRPNRSPQPRAAAGLCSSAPKAR